MLSVCAPVGHLEDAIFAEIDAAIKQISENIFHNTHRPNWPFRLSLMGPNIMRSFTIVNLHKMTSYNSKWSIANADPKRAFYDKAFDSVTRGGWLRLFSPNWGE